MRRRTILGAVSILGTTGCLRLEGGSGEPAESSTALTTSTSTATTTGTETATEPTKTGEPTPPYGMDEEGVRGVLYEMNRRALIDRAFKTEYRKVRRPSGDGLLERSWSVEDGRTLGTWQRDGGGPVESYRDDDVAWRERVDGEYTYGATRSASTLKEPTWRDEIPPLLRGLEWSSPRRVNETRPAEYEVSAVGVVPDSTAPGWRPDTITDLDSGTLRANENDVIRELDVTYTVGTEDGDFEQTYRSVYRLPVLDGVSVTEPSWMSTAWERRPKLSATRTDDSRFVRVRLEEGGPILSGSRITFYDTNRRDTGFNAHTTAPIIQGDELYLYRMDDSDGFKDGELVRDDPPSDVTPPVIDDDYEILTFRGDSIYHDRIEVT